jgi:hypothetical protein
MSHWRWRRMLGVPAILALALAALGIGSGAASAQTYYFGGYGSAASVSCPGWPTATCTVTLDQYVPAGQSVQVTLPDSQAVLTLDCTGGCFPGQSFSVNVSPTALAGGVQQYVSAGSCVNGSYPTQYGCSSAFVSIPPVSVYGYSAPAFSSYYPPAPPALPAYVQPPTVYTSTPAYSNGYWWSWDHDDGWSWSHHGNT